jgi:TATA-box binding protein (TBP) (component of TFIID and TFIIIB)
MFPRQVQNKVAAADRRKSAALSQIRDLSTALTCDPSDFRVSTMNIMVRLSICRVSLDRIRAMFDKQVGNLKHIADACFRNDVKLQTDHEFNNCLIVKYRVDDGQKKKRTIAIKLFVNGTLQVSGCRHVQDALMNGQSMCRFLENVCDVACGTYTVVDFDVHMVNCNFTIGAAARNALGINLSKLYSEVQQRCNLFQRYDASNHAGLIISICPQKSQTPVTVMVFANGNVIITGFKDWPELVEAFTKIVRLVDDSFENIVYPLPLSCS